MALCHPAVNLIYLPAVIQCSVLPAPGVSGHFSLLRLLVQREKHKGRRAVALACVWFLWLWLWGLFAAAIIIWCDQFAPKLHCRLPGVFGLWPGIGMYLGWGGCVDELRVCSPQIRWCIFWEGVSPRLSLFLSLLQLWILGGARKIPWHSRGGRARQGNILRRLTNGLRIFSILITWTVEGHSCRIQNPCGARAVDERTYPLFHLPV